MLSKLQPSPEVRSNYEKNSLCVDNYKNPYNVASVI